MEDADLTNFLADLKIRLNALMPIVHEQVRVYEERLAAGTLTKNPSPDPQIGDFPNPL